MSATIRFVPASSLTLDAFAEIYTRSFADYFYPMAQTTEGFAGRVRTEQQDLYRSVVMLADDVPAGQATLALRGARAWCGGFGIVPEFRGRKLGRPLFAEFVAQARLAGAKTLQLEALTRNAPALSVYTGAGMRITRDLRLLEWVHASDSPLPASTNISDQLADRVAITQCFQRLHPVYPGWGRELTPLLLHTGLLQLQLTQDNRITAYVLFWAKDGAAKIADVCAETPAQAAQLLAQLQSHYAKVTSSNEPADNPINTAFDQLGFREFDRQYELWMDL